MSAVLSMAERRRQIYKKTVVMDDLKLPRQERIIQIRKAKKGKDLAERRAVTIVAADSDYNAYHIRQLIEESGLVCVVKMLLNLPEVGMAQGALLDLCDSRPFELVSAGALSIFVEGMMDNQEYIQEKATECLAKLASLDVIVRDAILQEDGALLALKQNFKRAQAVSFGLSCLHLIVSVLNHEKLPSMDVVIDWNDFISYVFIYVDPENYFDVAVQTLQAISCISKYPGLIFESSIVIKLVKFLGHSNIELVEPALTTLGNAVASSEKSAQVALDEGVLLHIERLLQNPQLQARTCFLLANLAAGTPEQLHMLFHHSVRQFFKQLADLVCGDEQFAVKTRALNVIVTAIKNGQDCYVHYMQKLSCVAALCEALDFTWDLDLLKDVLGALKVVIEASARLHLNCLEQMAELDVERKLEVLENHSNRMVSNMSFFLLDSYFNKDEEQENFVPIDYDTAQDKETAPSEEAPDSVTSFGKVNTQSMNS